MAATFHPELDGRSQVHSILLELVQVGAGIADFCSR